MLIDLTYKVLCVYKADVDKHIAGLKSLERATLPTATGRVVIKPTKR